MRKSKRAKKIRFTYSQDNAYKLFEREVPEQQFINSMNGSTLSVLKFINFYISSVCGVKACVWPCEAL